MEQKIRKSSRLQHLKKQNIIEFMKNYGKDKDFNFDYQGKLKLTSSDTFANTVNELVNQLKGSSYPVIIGQVSGFYETATLAGILSDECKSNTKPVVLFFNKNVNNIQNAIYTSLLMLSCQTKEEFITTILGLEDIDIVKSLNSRGYSKLVTKALEEKPELDENNQKEIDEYIVQHYISKEELDNILDQMFSLTKIQNYILNNKSRKEYDKDAHLKKVLEKAKAGLSNEMYLYFEDIAKNIAAHLSEGDTYPKYVGYLFDDIKRNRGTHILDNDRAFNGYRKLISKNGVGNVKFLPNIDITKEEGLKELETILTNEKIIYDGLDKDEFPVDVAILPHIRRYKNVHSFVKRNSQFFVEANRENNSGKWDFQRTSALYTPDYESIGANFIEKELEEKPKLTNLEPLERLEGYPIIMSIAGVYYGSIYTNYADLENIIAMAKADKADTMFIQGLVYSNHKRYQTKRRILSDPKYPSLNSRLSAARRLVEDLNESNIKVVYQMSDEDENLRDELFYTHFFGELKKRNNFLSREDIDEKYDWIKTIINNDLVPYLIRSGRDITTYYNDKGEKTTRIGEICSYIKAIKDGTPLGNLKNLVDEYGDKLLDEKYFHNTDMFKVVNETLEKFDDKNSRISVDMIANPNFSSVAQYSSPDAGVFKRIKDYRVGAIENPNAQIVLDSRQAYMGCSIIGGSDSQMALNTPMLTDDSRYLNKEFLAGKKRILQDPTHKRVTQTSKFMNFPGSWAVTGDLDSIMRISPYWKRSREVMEYVQKTGEPLPKMVELCINDIQLGSITERVEQFLKLLDIGFNKYNANVISYLGDLQQGSNYPRFPIESRHTSAQSVGQQTVDFLKLQRPWLKSAFGIIKPNLFVERDSKVSVDEEFSMLILNYLYEKKLIERSEEYGYVYKIKDGIDYKTIDLQLPEKLKPYETHIRKRLNTINLLKVIKIAEGNHEKNTDWQQKGYKPLEALKSELEMLKDVSSSDVDIKYAEFILNSEGDYVEGSYCRSEINGYVTLSAHNMRAAANSGSVVKGMARYISSLGSEYKDVDIVEQGHLHIFESGVINGKLHLVIPSMAGQSGFEQMLGYSSYPRGLIKTYLPDGRITIDLISSNFLDNWKIINPEIREIGLQNYINNCLAQEVPIISGKVPEKIHQPYQRTLKPAHLSKTIGPKIPR